MRVFKMKEKLRTTPFAPHLEAPHGVWGRTGSGAAQGLGPTVLATSH